MITCRATPYTMYTSLMVYHLIESRVSWVNKFPIKNGVSTSMSLATKPDMSIKRIPFGVYAMAYIQTSNDMKTKKMLRVDNISCHYTLH